VGLFAAIPALVAYNAFNSRIRVLDNEMRNFSADFLNIIKRHIFKKAALMAFGAGDGGPRRAMTDINVTPLVDVMLVLLISSWSPRR